MIQQSEQPAGALAAGIDPGHVWRVGFRPDPWAWTPWQYASDDGRFPGRWDDPDGSFRTVYAGRDLLACLLEVLARFPPDPLLEERISTASLRIRRTPNRPPRCARG